jgi:hypothetical protein
MGCFPSAKAQYIEDENDFKFRISGLTASGTDQLKILIQPYENNELTYRRALQ